MLVRRSLQKVLRSCALAGLLGLLAACPGLAQETKIASPRHLHVHTDFSGGSGVVESINQSTRTIRITPTEHPDRGWVCWWYVHVTGIEPGEMLTLDVGPAPWATPDRAAFSEDGQVWLQTASGRREGKRIVYQQRVERSEAWFAWATPFTVEDAQQVVEKAARKCSGVEAFELCRTREGRAVPALRVNESRSGNSRADGSPKFGIWIQARQHAWEAGSSWVCAGFIEWLVSADPRATRLREIAEITVVPVMDIDNVAIGAGGKDQSPHDHNRDWGDQPHWNAVAAAMKSIKAMDQEARFDLFVDLHNPGASSRHPFYYITPRHLLSEQGRKNLDHFLATSQTEMTGPLVYLGETHASGADYDPRWKFIAKNWVSLHCADHVVAVTLETPWNAEQSNEVGYRVIGRQLGLAIERYLRYDPRK